MRSRLDGREFPAPPSSAESVGGSSVACLSLAEREKSALLRIGNKLASFCRSSLGNGRKIAYDYPGEGFEGCPAGRVEFRVFGCRQG
jgi:hypothetical protein